MNIVIDMVKQTIALSTDVPVTMQRGEPKGAKRGRKPKDLEDGKYCQNKFCPTPNARLIQFGRKRAKIGGEEFYFCSDDCKLECKEYTKKTLV